MASPYFIQNTKVFDRLDMSNSLISDSISSSEIMTVGVLSSWVNAIGASTDDLVIIQGSADNNVWANVTYGALGAVSSGTMSLEVEKFPYPFLRVFYDKSTSSSGLMTTWVCLKGT